MTSSLNTKPSNNALHWFEIAEANLDKLLRQLRHTIALVPEGNFWGVDTGYDDAVRAYDDLLVGLPPIDGWKPSARPLDYATIASQRFDADELMEPELHVSLGMEMDQPERELAEYRYRLHRARRRFVRKTVIDIVENINTSFAQQSDSSILPSLRQLDMLLGSAFQRPPEWTTLFDCAIPNSRLSSNELALQWDVVRARIASALYDDREPLPIPEVDLGDLSRGQERDIVVAELNWRSLDAAAFERLVFTLLSRSPHYDNVQWLTRTTATDRGRDLSATYVVRDSLAGLRQSRVIVQCKHWVERSVSATDVSDMRAQMELWAPPRVDVLVIATSGRFTTDAVDLVEKNNNSDRALRIEMWPESHLERLLAERPGLVAEFRLR